MSTSLALACAEAVSTVNQRQRRVWGSSASADLRSGAVYWWLLPLRFAAVKTAAASATAPIEAEAEAAAIHFSVLIDPTTDGRSHALVLCFRRPSSTASSALEMAVEPVGADRTICDIARSALAQRKSKSKSAAAGADTVFAVAHTAADVVSVIETVCAAVDVWHREAVPVVWSAADSDSFGAATDAADAKERKRNALTTAQTELQSATSATAATTKTGKAKATNKDPRLPSGLPPFALSTASARSMLERWRWVAPQRPPQWMAPVERAALQTRPPSAFETDFILSLIAAAATNAAAAPTPTHLLPELGGASDGGTGTALAAPEAVAQALQRMPALATRPASLLPSNADAAAIAALQPPQPLHRRIHGGAAQWDNPLAHRLLCWVMRAPLTLRHRAVDPDMFDTPAAAPRSEGLIADDHSRMPSPQWGWSPPRDPAHALLPDWQFVCDDALDGCDPVFPPPPAPSYRAYYAAPLHQWLAVLRCGLGEALAHSNTGSSKSSGGSAAGTDPAAAVVSFSVSLQSEIEAADALPDSGYGATWTRSALGDRLSVIGQFEIAGPPPPSAASAASASASPARHRIQLPLSPLRNPRAIRLRSLLVWARDRDRHAGGTSGRSGAHTHSQWNKFVVLCVAIVVLLLAWFLRR